MTRREAIERQLEPGTVILEGFDDAYIGRSHDGRAVYAGHRIAWILMERYELTGTEADDHIQHEIISALAELEGAPIIVYPLEE